MLGANIFDNSDAVTSVAQNLWHCNSVGSKAFSFKQKQWLWIDYNIRFSLLLYFLRMNQYASL